ncbi:MAG: type II toxin-antitoxin system RelE/ParE family toxin [Polyangia bacterium]
MIRGMEVRFEDDELDRLEVEAGNGRFCEAIVKAYRKRMQQIRAASDMHDFSSLKSLHFEKLKGDRAGQWSMRLNDQWRLTMKIERSGGQSRVVICCIEDYH